MSTSDIRGIYVSNAGIAGTEFTVPLVGVVDGRGVFDGNGASFAVGTSGGLYLLHARTDASDGLDTTLAFTPAVVDKSDGFGIDVGADGKLGLFYFSFPESTERLLRAGCL